MQQEWSHVGVRLTPELRQRLEELAATEGASISDLVRRAVQIFLSGGPESWAARQLEALGRQGEDGTLAGSAMTPEVRVHGEWLHSLPEPARRFVFQIGHVLSGWPADGAGERWHEFVQLTPNQIWCLELDPPIPTHLDEDEQVERLMHRSRLVEANDAFARVHGLSAPTPLLGRSLAETLGTSGDELPALLRVLIRQNYRVEHHALTQIRPDGKSGSVSLSLFCQSEGGMLLRCWGVGQESAVTEPARHRTTGETA